MNTFHLIDTNSLIAAFNDALPLGDNVYLLDMVEDEFSFSDDEQAIQYIQKIGLEKLNCEHSEQYLKSLKEMVNKYPNLFSLYNKKGTADICLLTCLKIKGMPTGSQHSLFLPQKWSVITNDQALQKAIKSEGLEYVSYNSYASSIVKTGKILHVQEKEFIRITARIQSKI